MKVSKRLMICVSCVLLGSNNLISASEILVATTTSIVQRSLSVRLNKMTFRGNCNFFNSYFVTNRAYHDSHDKENQPFIPNLSINEKPLKVPQTQAPLKDIHSVRYENLLIQSDQLCKKIEKVMNTLAELNRNQINLLPQDLLIKKESNKQKSNHTSMATTPINSHSSQNFLSHVSNHDSKESTSGEQDSEFFNYAKSKESTGNPVRKIDTESQMNRNDTLSHQYLSEVPTRLQGELANRIIRLIDSSYQINRQDVIKMLDLYTALAHRPIDGISKILTGQINTVRSGIHANILRYAKSRQTTLDTYRDLYTRLSNALHKEMSAVLSCVVEEMRNEKKHIFPIQKTDDNKSKGRQYYISVIVEGSHPLYPIDSNEVDLILKVYEALPKRPRVGITKVLAGQTNVVQSGIYANVLKYLKSQNSKLNNYRDMYLRLKKSLNERAPQIIDIILDENVHILAKEEKTSRMQNISKSFAANLALEKLNDNLKPRKISALSKKSLLIKKKSKTIKKGGS